MTGIKHGGYQTLLFYTCFHTCSTHVSHRHNRPLPLSELFNASSPSSGVSLPHTHSHIHTFAPGSLTPSRAHVGIHTIFPHSLGFLALLRDSLWQYMWQDADKATAAGGGNGSGTNDRAVLVPPVHGLGRPSPLAVRRELCEAGGRLYCQLYVLLPPTGC